MQTDDRKLPAYRLEDLPLVETYRGHAIRRSERPGQVRYHVAGWTEFSLAMARARVEMEQALDNMKAAYADWKADQGGKKKQGARLPGAEEAA